MKQDTPGIGGQPFTIDVDKNWAPKRRYIILDAGHGWDTIGKRSPDESLRENEFNKAIVHKLGYALSQHNAPYSILNPEHNDVKLSIRTHREKQIYDMAVADGRHPLGFSIHADAYTTEVAQGVTVFYHATSKAGKELANVFANVFKWYISAKQLDMKFRGIKASPSEGVPSFFMLRETKSPFILIESGFMTNPHDLELLKSEEYRNTLTSILLTTISNLNLYPYENL